ncbi:hypothetical protein PF005_g22095 [Phytophthora fragariae]|uniref:Integrase catalytic domain-containing protein n=1 Tax=Phytophthora fragariae TaxID=53985 RepID=A0A6A3PW22_9STRA|nr:hypothetical protein PF003_g17200 [Phytophthora fragariae]KAE8929036.1 hypothetical protein PF009_g20840 [Phytophthora fragariae]KAE8989038.1 hypothetical protein PF011_g18932 [Phytophthora fragariae]KAE9062194.1 hypothetical protein PF007_g29998 [Phytophthora fragariae]KAE9116535.1 hypothetical protein PF006_g19013 [Phytophthora fragariae]
MRHVVLKFGPFRELLTDGAPELTGKAIEQLVVLLQAQQTNPVPYRPQMVGLVERFHRTWKDCVSTYMNDDRQHDWDTWVDFAVYAYNSAQHSTVKLSPNELLRSTNVGEAGELNEYHRRLLEAMSSSQACADRARAHEQERQAKYYDRKVKRKRTFAPGDRVWMYRPPRGPKASKFVHQWLGPLRVVEPAGYDNLLLEREDTDGEQERYVAHESFLVTYYYPTAMLKRAAADIAAQLEYEDAGEREVVAATRAAVRAAAAASPTTAAAGSAKRPRRAVEGAATPGGASELLVELRRRRRRNKAGHYVLEYELRPAITSGQRGDASADDERKWVSAKEYDTLFNADRVVEDSVGREGV